MAARIIRRRTTGEDSTQVVAKNTTTSGNNAINEWVHGIPIFSPHASHSVDLAAPKKHFFQKDMDCFPQ